MDPAHAYKRFAAAGDAVAYDFGCSAYVRYRLVTVVTTIIDVIASGM